MHCRVNPPVGDGEALLHCWEGNATAAGQAHAAACWNIQADLQSAGQISRQDRAPAQTAVRPAIQCCGIPQSSHIPHHIARRLTLLFPLLPHGHHQPVYNCLQKAFTVELCPPECHCRGRHSAGIFQPAPARRRSQYWQSPRESRSVLALRTGRVKCHSALPGFTSSCAQAGHIWPQGWSCTQAG